MATVIGTADLPLETKAAGGAPNLIHKNLGVEATVLDEDEGIVEAYVSGIGNKDSVGDIIQPGAFDAFLKVRKPKGVWSHDWDRPVSKTLEIYEVAAGDPRLPMKMQLNGIGGLYVKTQFNLKTQEGRDAFENVRFFGEEAEWSIGYQVHEASYDKKLKANLLKTIELYEYSPVLFGANALTSTVSLKADLQDNGEYKYEIEGLDETQTKAVKAALEVVLKEASVDDASSEAQEESDMFKKNEATGLYEIDLDNGEVKTFRTEEKAEEFLNDCKAYVDAVEVAEKAAELAASMVDGQKAVVGSMEERSEKIRQALREAAGKDASAWPVATFESSVVYELYDYATGNFGFFQAEYTIEDDEVKIGDSVEVELVEVVLAKAALADAIKADMLTELKDALGEDADLVDIVEQKSLDAKAGRVLSKSNRSALEKAAEAIQAVLDADTTDEGQAEEKTAEEKALEEIEANVKSGAISEETATLLKTALGAKSEKSEELGEEFEGWTEDDFTAAKEYSELMELAELSEDDLSAVKEYAEALEAKDAEGDEDLSELEGLSDEDIEAVKEWAAALEEKDGDESGDEDEKSADADEIKSALDELAAIKAAITD